MRSAVVTGGGMGRPSSRDVHDDPFADELLSFLTSLSNNTQASKIGSIGSPTAVFALFEDDEIVFH
jgi:hypothetical protein